MTREKKYLPNLDCFRVIAAYFVMLFHFGWGGDDVFSEVFKYGYLGVYVFFCISGFITPLSMQWSGYRLSSWKSFLLSRMFRLYPAFAVIALIEILLYTCGGFMGYSYKFDQFTLLQVVSNFTWTAAFFEQDWFVPVFWTLAIEAQFIILMLVVYPLLQLKNEWLRVSPILLMIGVNYYLGRGVTVFSYSCVFGMGMLAYIYYNGKLSLPVFLLCLGIASAVNYQRVSDTHIYVALPVALSIAFLPDINSRLIKYLGKFTYSFFLIHITFGGAALFHMRHIPEEWYYQLPKVLIAGLISFGFSWVFYHKIEKPLHVYSRKLK